MNAKLDAIRVGLMCLLTSTALVAQELNVNGYSSIVIAEASADIFGIVRTVRDAAGDRGLQVFPNSSAVPSADAGKTMVALVSWHEGGTFGFIRVELTDLTTDAPIASSMLTFNPWPPAPTGLRRNVDAILDDLGYESFDEAAHEANLRFLGPIPSDLGR